MNNLLRKIQAALTATAFAEEGDVKTARQIMAEAGMERGTARRRAATLESLMAAAAFAEEGDVKTARQIMAEAGMERGTARHRAATLESVMAAAAFAEEGDDDTAKRLAAGKAPPPLGEPKTRPAEESPESPASRPRSLG